MKKLLLCGAAIGGLVLASAPAQAQIDVTVGGHTKNYMGWLDQDEAAGNDVREFDILRESELHFNAEGIADNGLTYGFHVEMEVDGGDSANTMEESYLYLSGTWGRFNLGSEDGANYLLQVAAPSADSNIDGIRQYINPVNYFAALSANSDNVLGAALMGDADSTEFDALVAAAAAVDISGGIDYANDATGKAEKLTYLSPVWNGFQAGASYTPDVYDNGSSTGLAGFNFDDQTDLLGAGWDLAGRYEGNFNNVGFAFGGGYTHIEIEDDTAASDDLDEWNLGIDLDIGPFGLGAIYTETDNIMGVADVDNETYVLGADYTTGPFQFGASYLNGDLDPAGAGDIETDRYTGGVIYTAAPGLTFRGSISFIDHDLPGAASDIDATSVLGGIQLNF